MTQKASAVLMMTPIGGAIGTVLMGIAADQRDMRFSFFVPLTAFVIILIYTLTILRKKRTDNGKIIGLKEGIQTNKI
jgi:FHS family L-fucose permease-like MFS transporter